MTPDARAVLDASCGIGTRAVGMGQAGFMVTRGGHQPRSAGFADVVWRMPAETGLYQPIVIAR